MATTDNDWRVRDASVLALGFFDKAQRGSVLQAVLKRLGDEQINVRRSAALSLGRLGQGSPGVHEALRAIQEDSDELLRLNVFLALQKLGKTEAGDLPRILDALQSPAPPTAEMATEILSARVNDFSQVLKPQLLLLLENPSQDTVARTLNILKSLTDIDESLTQQLARNLPSMDQTNRINTMKLLSRIDDSGNLVVPVCAECLKDSDPILIKEGLICTMKYRQSFEQHISLIIPLLNHEDEETKLLAVSLIRSTCKNATSCISPLTKLLKDPSSRVRLSAVSTLGRLGGSSDDALEALSETLKHQDQQLRISCVSALRMIGKQNTAKVVPVLEKALANQTDQRTQRIIASAIKELKGINTAK